MPIKTIRGADGIPYLLTKYSQAGNLTKTKSIQMTKTSRESPFQWPSSSIITVILPHHQSQLQAFRLPVRAVRSNMTNKKRQMSNPSKPRKYKHDKEARIGRLFRSQLQQSQFHCFLGAIIE